jgi:enamine deaminase RidA (YjgF/YER057c/UK114 family)
MSEHARRSIEVDGLGHKAPIPAASRIGPFVATGNIYGRDPTTQAIPKDAEDQVRLVFQNLEIILAAAGAAPGDLIKLEFDVASLSIREAINREWLRLFPDEACRPARHVKRYEDFPAGAVVNCEAWAVVWKDAG